MFRLPLRREASVSLHSLLVIIAVAFITASVNAQDDEVKSKGATVYYHGSKRPPANAWFTAGVNVQNTMKEPSNFKMKVTPMRQDNYAVHEISLPIPSESRMYIMQPITAGDTTAYAIDLIVNGRRTTNANSRETLTSKASIHQNPIIVFKGDSDLRVGPLTMANPDLAAEYITGFIDTRQAPQHWAGYDKAAAILVLDPDFKAISQRQYNAIRDYVLRGGTLIFAYPKGIMAMKGTILEPMLPVKPLRIRPIESTKALQHIGGKEMVWKNGADFLESIPVGDGVTTVEHEGFPVIRWRRTGLGYVGTCAFNPSHDDILSQKDIYATLYKHLLSYAGHGGYASSSKDLSLSRSVDKMTGIKIPKSGTIKFIVFGYLGVFFVLIGAGVALKRHSISWGVVTAVSLTMIVGIFAASAVMRSNLPAKTGTMLAFTCFGEDRLVREQLCGLLVKGEVTTDMETTNPDLLIRSMPSPWTDKSLQAAKMKSGQIASNGKIKFSRKTDDVKKAQETFQDPITISMTDGLAGLLNITLRDGKPRFFNTQSMSNIEIDVKPPIVSWDGGQPKMEAWQLPAGQQAESAVFVTEEGFFNVTVKGGNTLSISKASKLPMENPVVNHLVEYMSRAGCAAPMLAIFSTADADPESFFPDDFKVMGRNIALFPVKELLPKGDVSIPPERIRLSSHFRDMLLLRIDGYWAAKETSTPRDPYMLQAQLPLGYNQLKMNAITVNLESSQGTNIEFDVFLVPEGNVKKKVQLTANKDGSYSYDFSSGDKKARRALDPANGIVTLGILPKEKTRIKDPVARLRLNSWRLTSVSVSAKGTFPKDQQGSL